jgi:hypothetical protein
MRRNVALDIRMDQGVACGLIYVNHLWQSQFDRVARVQTGGVVVARCAAAKVRGGIRRIQWRI